ncbi:hypothetical protein [Nitratidesulfovibrio sp. SRB-5]|uniref:hypothetical protein n=1 Tax=Nitratidesulfovibrio sp. SRB-5 TaxID=2872636 RepID=UPI0010253D07|nr:hypothetical protein [Nitratidesulfovibrio sp. SRB-5]MBZ2172187.1 hypothetical protein [Nitratidesulfovibrio sp. SRB-5]RXF77383.1 hypothetical protein EKK70_06960 [Desulfovibrio sp. DS-1]
MQKITLKESFRYWRNGCWPEDYPAGVVKVDAEVAAQARAAGVVAEDAKNSKHAGGQEQK